MKKPKAGAINLPYSGAVASYARDQGGLPGNSFLGELFRKGAVGGGKSGGIVPPTGVGMLK